MDYTNMLASKQWHEVPPAQERAGTNELDGAWVEERRVDASELPECDILLAVRTGNEQDPHIVACGNRITNLVPAPQYGPGWRAPQDPIFPTNAPYAKIILVNSGNAPEVRMAHAPRELQQGGVGTRDILYVDGLITRRVMA